MSKILTFTLHVNLDAGEVAVGIEFARALGIFIILHIFLSKHKEMN